MDDWLTLSGWQPGFSGYAKCHYKTNTNILRLGLCSWGPSFKDDGQFVSAATLFSLQYIIAYYIFCIHTTFGRDLWRNTKVMGHWVRLPIFLVRYVRRVWSKMDYKGDISEFSDSWKIMIFSLQDGSSEISQFFLNDTSQILRLRWQKKCETEGYSFSTFFFSLTESKLYNCCEYSHCYGHNA